MSYLIAIVLGALQGFTEFIPISSSGHLVLIREIFGWPDQGIAFDAVLHLGTLLAVFIALYKEWAMVWRGFIGFLKTGKLWQTAEQKLFSALVLATIPAAASGFFLESIVEERFRGVLSLGLLFAALGAFYFFVEFTMKQKAQATLQTEGQNQVSNEPNNAPENEELKKQPNLKGAIWIGLAQVLALLPGVSRSGVTMATGMLNGLDRRSAAKFAFLLSGPIVLGAGAFSLWSLWSGGTTESQIEWGPLIVGMLIALVVGWLAIKGMLNFLKRYSLRPFAIYLLGLGGCLILLRVFNVI